MESSTKILRRMLDERGVEWKAWDGTHPITVWHDETYLYEFVEYRLVNGAKQVNGCPSDNDGHCELTIKVFNCTPEQAIAATLGSCNCSNNCTNGERTEACHDKNGFDVTFGFECTVCGAMTDGYMLSPADTGHYKQFNFCPMCGRRIEQ